MNHVSTWRWEFFGFRSMAEGRPVQTWFNNLPEDDKDEIVDLLNFVQNVTNRLWPEWIFDPLRGEGGISEIKVPEIRCIRGRRVCVITYRIYGYFGPDKHCYTFLHGTDKDVKNDQVGKQIAGGRVDELSRGIANIHRFVFEEGSDSEAKAEPRRPI